MYGGDSRQGPSVLHALAASLNAGWVITAAPPVPGESTPQGWAGLHVVFAAPGGILRRRGARATTARLVNTRFWGVSLIAPIALPDPISP